MADCQQELKKKVKLINASIDKHMPAESARPTMLHRAMRYSVFAGGKRLRGTLALASAEAIGGKSKSALLSATAIELVHTYTLIHDDLPCMDNDNLRRGKPTCHIAFDEATAILAGDALLALAFELIGNVIAPPPYVPNQLTLELARAVGSYGVIGGQIEDIAAEGKKPDLAIVKYIHLHKTAILVSAALKMGGIAAGANADQLKALASYGTNLGLAFQIIDDILNEISSPEVLGKASGTDKKQRKMTYISAVGIDKAKTEAIKYSHKAVLAIQNMKGNADFLVSFARIMLNRQH